MALFFALLAKKATFACKCFAIVSQLFYRKNKKIATTLKLLFLPHHKKKETEKGSG